MTEENIKELNFLFTNRTEVNPKLQINAKYLTTSNCQKPPSDLL